MKTTLKQGVTKLTQLNKLLGAKHGFHPLLSNKSTHLELKSNKNNTVIVLDAIDNTIAFWVAVCASEKSPEIISKDLTIMVTDLIDTVNILND